MCISLHFHFTFHAPSLVLKKKKKTGTAIFVFPFFGCHYYFCFHCIFFPRFHSVCFSASQPLPLEKKNKTSGFCFEFFSFSFWNGQWEYLYVSACLSTPTASLDITLVCCVCFFFNLEQNVKKLQKIK